MASILVMKYKRIVKEAYGSADVLKMAEQASPESKRKEFMVRAPAALAAGVGFADVMAQHGD